MEFYRYLYRVSDDLQSLSLAMKKLDMPVSSWESSMVKVENMLLDVEDMKKKFSVR